MSNESITFHFSNSDTTTFRSSFDRLSSQWCNRPRSSDLEFVVHHMSQSLIINHSNINIRRKFLSRNPRIHGFISIEIVSGTFELMAKIFHCGRTFGILEFEGCGILREAVEGAGFSC